MSRPLPFAEPVYITRPIAPRLEDYVERLRPIWKDRVFTNNGTYARHLEQELSTYLGAPNLSLVGNGTQALMLACRALELTGEVITTPFTFAATVHALTWCGLTPVFADIDEETLTIDPWRVEEAIRPSVDAILGVHVYGMPCDVLALQKVAYGYGKRLIYDAAHAFGTEINGRPIATFAAATAFSFHATKLFHTAEGGAVVVADPTVKARVDALRNFGIVDGEPELPGMNAKMNEMQAALGLLNLKLVEAERAARGVVADVYRARLAGLPGIRLFTLPAGVTDSRQYFVLRVENRDAFVDALRTFNVHARRYFYPLCSEFPHYRDLPSANPANLPVAHRASREVVCLPYYGGVDANRICDMIEHIQCSQ